MAIRTISGNVAAIGVAKSEAADHQIELATEQMSKQMLEQTVWFSTDNPTAVLETKLKKTMPRLKAYNLHTTNYLPFVS
jgi:hypothetical protein